MSVTTREERRCGLLGKSERIRYQRTVVLDVGLHGTEANGIVVLELGVALRMLTHFVRQRGNGVLRNHPLEDGGHRQWPLQEKLP